MFKNRNAEDPSIIIELKYTKDVSKGLQDLAHQACIQITEKQYGYPMQKVIKIGLAHCGKQARMYVQRTDLCSPFAFDIEVSK